MTCLVQTFPGIASNWKEELYQDIALLQSSSGMDDIITILKRKIVRPGYHLFIANLERFNRLQREPGETSWTLRNEEYTHALRDLETLMCKQ